MLLRLSYALALSALLAIPATAQVVRFQTNVGDFDMVLNPTSNPLLQNHVDNMLAYVEDNTYHGTWINRADNGFVLQMGGFYSHTKRPPATVDSTRPVVPFTPVPGSPGIPGLSNTAGTVSLALPGDGQGGTNQDAGTSSFFINIGSNTFLDADFTVFAAIPDMSVVNTIMGLMNRDYTTDPAFGEDPQNLGFTDVPIQDNGQQVFIKRAFLVTDSLTVARDIAGVSATMATSAANFDSEAFANSTSTTSTAVSEAPITSPAVPEPAGILLAACGAIFAVCRRRRK